MRIRYVDFECDCGILNHIAINIVWTCSCGQTNIFVDNKKNLNVYDINEVYSSKTNKRKKK